MLQGGIFVAISVKMLLVCCQNVLIQMMLLLNFYVDAVVSIHACCNAADAADDAV